MDAAAIGPLPRWNTDNIFSSLEGDDYRAAFAQLEKQVAELEQWFDDHQIRRLMEPPTQSTSALAQLLGQTLGHVNEVSLQAGTLDSFIYAFLSTNSYDTIAARETSKLEILNTRRQKLDVRLQGWIGSLATLLDKLIPLEPQLQKHAYYLHESARQSQYLMSEELESLAADLSLDGGTAFGKLQGNVTSQLKVPLERDGKTELLPITVIRNLCFDGDRVIRERAYHAEQAVSMSSQKSSALNSLFPRRSNRADSN